MKGPENRLHGLVFVGRSLALMTLYYWEEQSGREPNYDWNLAIQMATLAAADLCSWSVGKEHQSSTIRDLPAHPAVRLFYSFMQFGGSGVCLFGLRRYSTIFYFPCVMQVNSFLMTLRRKNLVSKPLNMVLYGLLLAGGFVFQEYERSSGAITHNELVCRDLIFHGAALLRLGPRLPVVSVIQNNKYLLWLVVGLLLRKFRYVFEGEEPLPGEIYVLRYTLIALLVTVFVWKGILVDRLRKDTKKTV